MSYKFTLKPSVADEDKELCIVNILLQQSKSSLKKASLYDQWVRRKTLLKSRYIHRFSKNRDKHVTRFKDTLWLDEIRSSYFGVIVSTVFGVVKEKR